MWLYGVVVSVAVVGVVAVVVMAGIEVFVWGIINKLYHVLESKCIFFVLRV